MKRGSLICYIKGLLFGKKIWHIYFTYIHKYNECVELIFVHWIKQKMKERVYCKLKSKLKRGIVPVTYIRKRFSFVVFQIWKCYDISRVLYRFNTSLFLTSLFSFIPRSVIPFQEQGIDRWGISLFCFVSFKLTLIRLTYHR